MALRDHPGLAPDDERSLESGIDVVLVPSAGSQAAPGVPGECWHYVQLWTDQRIYAFDMTLTCVAVLNRETGASEVDPVVGARLTGGQLVDGDRIKMVYPLPVPGTQGVLEGGAGPQRAFVRTPPIKRVIMRLVAVGGTPRDKRPTWEAVADWQTEVRDCKPTVR
jgi:hypothetical protein